MPSDELTKLSIDNAPKPQISAEGERAKTNIANARAKRNLGTVSANQLSNPVDTVTVPQPQVSSIPPQSGQLVTNITRDNAGFIAAQTEEAKQVKDLQNQFGALNDQGSLSDLFNTTRDQFGGGSDSLKELKDIQLQLTDMDTGSTLTKTRIEGAGGQTLGQAQREVTQEDREAAVRSAGLAARASVIQGNIQTANAAAKSAVDIAYQDRTLKSTNLLNQISMVQSKVDQQTAQLLETEKRGYEADLAAVKELKDATQNAIVNGASQAEVSQLMDSTVDDATKLALAQTITARGAGEMRGLDMEQSRASIESSRASTANSFDSIRSRKLNDELAQSERANAGNQFGTVDGKAQSTVQASAQGYAERLVESEGTIAQLGSMFTGQDAFGGLLPNAMQSSERQQFEQSKRNFINSVLRRESGAAIADSEFDSADLQYFPQRGDSPEVVVQKAQNRNTVINNLYREANVFRPVNSGDIIESDGIKYQVGADGQTLTKLD